MATLFLICIVRCSYDVIMTSFPAFMQALSNQKYRELYEEFQDVGLMTGDVTINPSASALVMTTEVQPACSSFESILDSFKGMI